MLINTFDNEDIEQEIAIQKWRGAYSEEYKGFEIMRDRLNIIDSITNIKMKGIPWEDKYVENNFDYEYILDKATIEQILYGKIRYFCLLLLKGYRISDIAEIMNLSRTDIKHIKKIIFNKSLK